MAISRRTLLRVAPDVTVRYRDGADVEIALGPERIGAGPHGVSILEAFRTATPMGEALGRLGARTTGMQDWIELSAMIGVFADLGVLRDVDAAPAPALNPEPGRFDSARVHVGMLDDRTRTQRYLEAIRTVVRPGDVVVEIGTGTGVLAVAAARAGAARVYAVESSSIGQVAKRVFQANGLSDRITLVEGLSSRVALPERCDVLIAELIGKDPLEEGVLEFTRDGVARFLKPEGRLIPSKFEVHALPVEIPDDVRRHWTFTEAGTAEWREAYGIDFSPLVEASRQSLWRMSVAPRRLRSFGAMTPPLRLLERDLARLGDVGFVERASSTVLRAGEVHGVVLSFAATLAPGIVLDTDPREYRADNSWDYQFWGLPVPVTVRQGEQLEVTLRHRLDGPPVDVRVLNA